MTAEALLAQLRQRGGDLELVDGHRLVLVEPETDHGWLPASLVDALTAHRPALVALLTAEAADVGDPLDALTEAGGVRHGGQVEVIEREARDLAPVLEHAVEEVVDEAETRRRRFGTDLESRRRRAAHVDRLLAAEHAPAGLPGWLRARW